MQRNRRRHTPFQWVNHSSSFDQLSELWQRVCADSDVKVDLPEKPDYQPQALANRINEQPEHFPNAHAFAGSTPLATEPSRVWITTVEEAERRGFVPGDQ